jgi:hypothetical protein
MNRFLQKFPMNRFLHLFHYYQNKFRLNQKFPKFHPYQRFLMYLLFLIYLRYLKYRCYLMY